MAPWLADDMARYDCSVGGLYPEATGQRSFDLGFSSRVEHPWTTKPIQIGIDCELGPSGVLFWSTGYNHGAESR